MICDTFFGRKKNCQHSLGFELNLPRLIQLDDVFEGVAIRKQKNISQFLGHDNKHNSHKWFSSIIVVYDSVHRGFIISNISMLDNGQRFHSAQIELEIESSRTPNK